LIKAKRREEGVGLRAAARDSGVSASTLSRIERGGATSYPDAETIAKLASWLNVPIGTLLGEQDQQDSADEPNLSMPEFVEVHLRADKNLSPKTAQALANMFRMLYDQFLEMEDHAENEA
jgi:transcriptional regulator with XRE-family HTH domain